MEQHRKDRLKWEARQALYVLKRDWPVFVLIIAATLLGAGPFFRDVFWS
jgi:hypothetical protein